MKVKIIGAGSAGIHLAQACRRMDWEVGVVDNDVDALRRMRQKIYPARYGNWDDKIKLYSSEAQEAFYCNPSDIIMVATPPDVRMKLALNAIKENPKLLHLEKPLCTPDLKGVAEFEAEMKNHPDTIVTVGYDHAVSKSICRVIDLLRDKSIGEVLTIDVEFREHWKGIFAVHTWLSGPKDSYLGYWERGGGAGNEHSHALHLWLTLARRAWGARGKALSNVFSKLDIVPDSRSRGYDRVARFLLSALGGDGAVVQDVVTSPPNKWARIQGDEGFIEWHANGDPDGDVVKYETSNRRAVEIFPKKRPDDFFYETQHYDYLIKNASKGPESPILYHSGLEVMKILNKAYYG